MQNVAYVGNGGGMPVDKTFEDPQNPGRTATQITLANRFAWFKSEECKVLLEGVTRKQGGNRFNIPPDPGIKGSPPCQCLRWGYSRRKCARNRQGCRLPTST